MSTTSHDYPLLLTAAQYNALLPKHEETITTKQGRVALAKDVERVAKKNRTRMVLEDLKNGR